MEDHELFTSPSSLLTTGSALIVFGMCVGWLLGGSFVRRQLPPATTPKPPGPTPGSDTERVNLARTDLLAAVNREIHTPLNSVLGYTDLLLDTSLLSDQREFAVNVRQSAEVLGFLLDDISDYSRLQHGTLELASDAFDFGETLSQVLDLLSPRANEKGIELAHDIVPHVDLRVKGDPARTRQVLLNLISNALKFTAEGHVLVRVDVLPGTPGQLRCRISDTGCGISEEGQTDLFVKPGIAGAGIVPKAGGPGLGIAISRCFIEKMGGQIGVVSRPGSGSDFWFQLPLAGGDPATSTALPRPVMSDESPRVLVVEPALIARQMLTAQLGSAGYVVEALTSGQEALAKLRQSAAGGRPFQSAVFAEKLPDLSGRDFAQAVRTDPVLRATGLVCLRRQGVRSVTKGSALLGVVELVKPVLRAGPLLNAVRAAPTLQPVAEPTLAPGAPWATAGPEADGTIGSGTGVFAPVGFALLAEDNELDQRVLVEMLRRIGWACKVADNGADAIRLSEVRRYDIILMDCHLPEISGFDATRRIRQTEAVSKAPRIPIVAVTADTMADSRVRCLAAGMDDCLTKPFRRAELEEMLKRWAPRTRSAPAPVA